MDERWKHVADIIGADDVQMDIEDLDEEGQNWARRRFGGEARYLVKVFDYLALEREGASEPELRGDLGGPIPTSELLGHLHETTGRFPADVEIDPRIPRATCERLCHIQGCVSARPETECANEHVSETR